MTQIQKFPISPDDFRRSGGRARDALNRVGGAPVFKQPSGGTPPWARVGAPLPARGVRPYPTTPVPLSAAAFRDISERQSAASRRFKEALARRAAGSQRVESEFQAFRNRLGRQTKRTSRGLLSRLGGRGLARQPIFAGQGLRSIRDASAEQLNEAERERAFNLQALDEMARLARESRDEEQASIERYLARRHSDLTRLIRAAG